jgi:hypothetical protein
VGDDVRVVLERGRGKEVLEPREHQIGPFARQAGDGPPCAPSERRELEVIVGIAFALYDVGQKNRMELVRKPRWRASDSPMASGTPQPMPRTRR